MSHCKYTEIPQNGKCFAAILLTHNINDDELIRLENQLIPISFRYAALIVCASRISPPSEGVELEDKIQVPGWNAGSSAKFCNMMERSSMCRHWAESNTLPWLSKIVMITTDFFACALAARFFVEFIISLVQLFMCKKDGYTFPVAKQVNSSPKSKNTQENGSRLISCNMGIKKPCK